MRMVGNFRRLCKFGAATAGAVGGSFLLYSCLEPQVKNKAVDILLDRITFIAVLRFEYSHLDQGKRIQVSSVATMYGMYGFTEIK